MQLYKVKQKIKKWWRISFQPVVVEKKASEPTRLPVAAVPSRGTYKGPKRIRKCLVTHKFMFTREQAEKNKVKSLKNKKATYLRIYLCQFCGKWHLTHKKDLLKK